MPAKQATQPLKPCGSPVFKFVFDVIRTLADSQGPEQALTDALSYPWNKWRFSLLSVSISTF